MLDTPEPQVMIEARIIETTKRFTRTLGIHWGFDARRRRRPRQHHRPGLPQQRRRRRRRQPGDRRRQRRCSNLRLGNVLNTFTLDLPLQAAESEGLINILSAPKVATLNNQQATIQSGLQIPVQTVANNTVTVQFVNATLRLDVTPQVTAEGTVLMDIDISKREPQLAFLVPGATNAPIATKEARDPGDRPRRRHGGDRRHLQGHHRRGRGPRPGPRQHPDPRPPVQEQAARNENEELLIFITPRVIKL